MKIRYSALLSASLLCQTLPGTMAMPSENTPSLFHLLCNSSGIGLSCHSVHGNIGLLFTVSAGITLTPIS